MDAPSRRRGGPRELLPALAPAVLLALTAACAYRVAVRPNPPDAEPMYYSDLGPDSLDVSGEPEARRRDYAAYARLCSRCHTLARSLNAPPAGRAYWELYVSSMRFVNWTAGNPSFTRAEIASVLDFLEYDGRARKSAPEFAARTAELRRRFEAVQAERVRRLQKNREPAVPLSY